MAVGNPDIKSAVVTSRGLLKKIQLVIPGYSGYRKLEDLRVADELLRKQISVVLQRALNSLQSERSNLVNQNEFSKLTLIGSGISKVQQFQGELLHSQQGYSGISSSIRVDESKLGTLYDYDLKFLDISSRIDQMADFTSVQDISDRITKLSDEVNNAKSAWEARLLAVEKIFLVPDGDKQ